VSSGEKKMKNTVIKGTRLVTVASSPVSAFIDRSLERARKMDRGERFSSEITLTFEDPSDLVRVLSAERVRVLRAVRAKATPVSELAVALKRDRKAVRRDVSLLESFGLVRTREEPNPGHGRRIVVEPLAAKYQLVASI
jgi:predicted transcriptional regulator